MNRKFWLEFSTAGALLLSMVAPATAEPEKQTEQRLPENLTDLGLKELLDFELVVTSPGKKAQPLSDVASAIFVLTNEDIRRAGVTHIVDALRLVPGVNVARVSASQWAVSIRGFNQVYAHKLLVLVDGVSIFSPLTNGVYWETLDPLLADIDRIEIIRGPGASLWGANAVNGVINIITRSAKATTGGLASAGGGTGERAYGSVRYGTQMTDTSFGRLSGKVSSTGDNRLASGGNADDDWTIGSVDARIDKDLGNDSTISLLGHAFSERDEVRPSTPILDFPYVDSKTYAGDGRWQGGFGAVDYETTFSETSKFNLLGSVTSQDRSSELISLHYEVYELEGTQRLSPLEGHDVVFGAAYRLFESSSNGTYAQDTVPGERSMHRVNWFFQDEMELFHPEWHLILGSKFERNTSTEFEYMPNARMIWAPNRKNSVWFAVSRAVATPALVFDDSVFPVASIPGGEGEPGTLVEVFGNRQVESEDLLAYELGYRTELAPSLSVDFAAFYNRYDNVFSQEPGEPFFAVPNRGDQPAVIVPLQFANAGRAQTIGGEGTAEWRASEWMKFQASYSYFNARAEQGDSLDSQNELFIEGSAPRHSVVLRSSFDLTNAATLDVVGRYTDALAFGDIPDYYEADVHLTYRVSEAISLSFIGQNLLDSAHQEYVGNLFGPPPIEIRRSFVGSVSYRF